MSSAKDPSIGSSLVPAEGAVILEIRAKSEERSLIIRDEISHLAIHAAEGTDGSVFVRLENVSSFSCEITLERGAKLTVIFLETSSAPLSIRQRTTIGDGAHLHLLNVSLGSSLTQELRSTVTGNDGVSSVDWLAYAKKTDSQTLDVRNIFDGRNGGGEVTMRAVAEQKASVGVRGMIDIGEHGGGTDTYLTQQVLMLDPTSKIDASPALEIKTNDVKASHSASVSRVTPEDLYYFSARGIDPQEARGLLVRGFLDELSQRITHTDAREQIAVAIAEKYAA